MSERNHAVTKDGDVKASRIEDALERMSAEDKENILSDFNAFKSYLAKRVKLAKAIGLNEEQMAVAAQKIAQYLSEREEPRNSEEALLQELWKVGEEQERHALAHMLVRLAQQNDTSSQSGSIN
ncbi:hypothetical protein FHS18_002370 [Paenibacillus phyllosphaerae]|uniref:DUF3243 domain-containing protein n=1 Tax=Paenibacillus phyllosphaerae TaxID=274593 RepID=A0A7W5AX10_9BACL|nr:DUF3243 domain-containing protein [Paenibacillus phyllosphaerae]MBB3110303.1 hypothetical protein [Paenibacillus phyllosphaerae]